jgi:hypothetical protein
VNNQKSQIHSIISSLAAFTTYFGRIDLRPYQLEAANAVLDAVFKDTGETFVWKFARQGGKDETLAAMYQYIMTVFAHREVSLVAAAPTMLPQSDISLRRLESRLSSHLALQQEWKRPSRFSIRVRQARTLFLSAQSHANVVGATAWPLLVINEAQDVLPHVYDKRFAPMAAAFNAVRLIVGTAWTHDSLLAREERALRIKEAEDGVRRVFVVDGHEIAKVHAPYGKFLEGEIARLGANHPIVVSQYLCREIDAQSGMFNETRRALMQCDRPPRGGFQPPSQVPAPRGAGIYAFLIDVAGMNETPIDMEGLGNTGRDSTTLSIVDVDLSSLPTLQAPTYRIVHRLGWIGLNHAEVYGKVKALADVWRPRNIVLDATGVGEALWALLARNISVGLHPVKFTQQLKSEIGWRFLSIIETGRFRDCAPSDAVDLQYARCISEILPGPAKTLRWGVPDGARGPDGLLVHDDHLLADSLVSILDRLEWSLPSRTLIIEPKDPLDEMSRTRPPLRHPKDPLDDMSHFKDEFNPHDW